jgi:hypothetical protein
MSEGAVETASAGAMGVDSAIMLPTPAVPTSERLGVQLLRHLFAR